MDKSHFQEKKTNITEEATHGKYSVSGQISLTNTEMEGRVPMMRQTHLGTQRHWRSGLKAMIHRAIFWAIFPGNCQPGETKRNLSRSGWLRNVVHCWLQFFKYKLVPNINGKVHRQHCSQSFPVYPHPWATFTLHSEVEVTQIWFFWQDVTQIHFFKAMCKHK